MRDSGRSVVSGPGREVVRPGEDALDLCVARQRDGFVTAAASETALKPELLKRDLGRVLLQLEELQEARLRAAVAPKHAAPTASAEGRS